MKDVVGCDKPRRAPKQALTRGFPNGETHLDLIEKSYAEFIGIRRRPGEVKHLSSQRKRNRRDSLSSGERKGNSLNRLTVASKSCWSHD